MKSYCFFHYICHIISSHYRITFYDNGCYRYINQAFAKLFGYEKEDILSKEVEIENLFEIDSFQYAMDHGTVFALNKLPYRLRGVKKDGSAIDVEVYSQQLKDSSAIMGTLIDITEQIKLQEE